MSEHTGSMPYDNLFNCDKYHKTKVKVTLYEYVILEERIIE